MNFRERNKYQDLEPKNYGQRIARCLICGLTTVCFCCCFIFILILSLLTTFYLYPRGVSTNFNYLAINSFTVSVLPPSLSFNFRVDLSTKNENYLNIHVNYINMNITYNGKFIGLLTEKNEKVLRARQTTVHSCNLIFTNQENLFQNILLEMSMELIQKGEIPLQFKGDIQVSFIGIKIHSFVNFTQLVSTT